MKTDIYECSVQKIPISFDQDFLFTNFYVLKEALMA